MNVRVSIHRNAKRIAIILFFLILILLFGNFSNVKASSGPVLEFKKESYSEQSNELVVAVCISPNASLKQFNMTITYDKNKLEIIPYQKRKCSIQ